MNTKDPNNLVDLFRAMTPEERLGFLKIVVRDLRKIGADSRKGKAMVDELMGLTTTRRKQKNPNPPHP